MRKSSSRKSKGVALVTGATGIIGPTICEALHRDGWQIAACASSPKSFTYYAKLFPKPLVADGKFIADLTNRQACHRLVRNVERKLGPVSLVVNNAATNPITTKLGEITEEYAHRMMEVDLLSPLWLIQAAEKSLVAQRGSVVNISSVEAERSSPQVILYPVLKAALEKLTSVLALGLGPQGVRVNCIRVGSVPGPAFMRGTLEKLSRAQARRLYAHIMPPHRAWRSYMSTTGRAGLASDVAETVAFLASSRAEFFNGATLPLEGGISHRWDVSKPDTNWDSKQAVRDWLAKEGIKLEQ